MSDIDDSRGYKPRMSVDETIRHHVFQMLMSERSRINWYLSSHTAAVHILYLLKLIRQMFLGLYWVLCNLMLPS